MVAAGAGAEIPRISDSCGRSCARGVEEDNPLRHLAASTVPVKSSIHPMSICRFLPVLLGLAACAPVVAGSASVPSQDAPQEPELGYLGFQPPEVSDIKLTDTLLHQDEVGGVSQDLMGIAGTPGGGFGLVWRDQRDGMLGLYFARVGPDGQRREDERSITSLPATVRKFDPAVAVAPDGSGAVGWISIRQEGQQRTLRPWLRCFNAEGRFYGSDLLLGDPPAPGKARGGREETGPASRSPVLLARADGTRTMVWTVEGRLRVADFDVAGSPLRAAYDLGPAGTEPEIGIAAVSDPSGGVAALWTGKGHVWFACRGAKDTKSEDTQLGEGQARALALDPTGGFWALWQRGDAVVLRHVSAEGQADRAETTPIAGPVRDCDMAAHANGIAIAVLRGEGPAPASRERGGRGRDQMQRPGATRGEARAPAPASAEDGDARVELWLCDPKGALAQPEPLAITSDVARNVGGAFVASNGQELLVAWTDSRRGDADVWARIVDLTKSGADRLRPEVRINSDGPSADQINPDVDVAGDRGLAVWQDRRTHGSLIFARRFHAQGLTGDEIGLPAKFGDVPAPDLPGGAVQPSVALRADGSALVTWIQRGEGRDKAVAQVLAADGRAISALMEIDARDGFAPDRVALSALPGDRGWLAVWPGGGKNGVWSRHIAPDGALPGPARRVSDAADDVLTNADVTLLDDGRLVAAWTMQRAGSTPNEGWFVRARFLDAEGGTKGSELSFEPSRRNQDHDPALAPAKGGGFLMAWCSGPPADPTHDVVVRLFDAQGKPVAPILTPCFLANEQDFADVARLADGSFVVAWEDDISYFDQSYVRRILPSGKAMGPWLRIGKLDTSFVPDRIVPRIAAMGAGWAAVIVDRQRSLGFDVRVKVVGPAFDQPSGD